MLALRGVALAFGGVRAIDGLDLELGDRTVGALIGANGAGKSSVLNVVNRFYRPDSGSVHYGDVDLLALAPHEVIGHGISRSFQNVVLFDELSVLENLLVGADHIDRPSLLSNLFRLPGARRHNRDAHRRAARVLEFLEIGQLSHRRAGELAFGDRKLVDLGRALTAGPSLLLLDEPASGMPEDRREALPDLIRQLPSEWGASVLLVDHDMELVLSTAAHVVAMDFGCKIAEGPPELVRNHPKVLAAYLGENGAEEPGA
jgi:branched-chain amino acid transport system ATP-binding protein